MSVEILSLRAWVHGASGDLARPTIVDMLAAGEAPPREIARPPARLDTDAAFEATDTELAEGVDRLSLMLRAE